MKRILILIAILTLFFITSCINKTYTVTLNYESDLFGFISYNENNVVKNKEEFILPQVKQQIYIDEEIEEFKDYILCKRNINNIKFYGWELGDEIITSSSIKVNDNITLTPKYEITTNTYIIKLYTKGVKVDLQNKDDIYNFNLPTIENENYTFGGWYYNELYVGKPIDNPKYSNLNNETIIYAKLTPTIDYANGLINNLSDKLTIYDIEDINHAYKTYNDLSYQDKQKVENYSKLENAYSQIDNLNKAYQVYNQLLEIYQQDVSANLKKELDMIIENLETFEGLESLIPGFNYDEFIDLVNKVNDLYELYAEEAKQFDLKIAALPIFQELYYENEIISLYDEYKNLDHNFKVLLSADEKLVSLYQNLLNIENQNIIYYVNTPNTNNIYTSKEQLFESFFNDFYYYIAAYHGLEHLINNKIYNVEDFVNLAKDFTGAGANNLYGIGNVAGRYMLEKDINGILANQTENGFFGFCYKNNLYQDVLPFFINFFAYWRIDEKYANTSNYGADIFAESWAPTVDIAKFFYYDENTSYVKTERMIDCLTNTASVLYKDDSLSTKLPIYSLRGYIFDGWYDNENCTGSKITDLSQTNSKKLFAKWIIDQNQVDKDQANLVDIYIYNLTTSKAVVNSITIGYVEDMYNNLSEKGKQYVNNYETLKQLLTKYK